MTVIVLLFGQWGGVVGPHGGKMKNWDFVVMNILEIKIIIFICLPVTEGCDSFLGHLDLILSPNKTNERISPGKKTKKTTHHGPPSDQNGSLSHFGDRTRSESSARTSTRRRANQREGLYTNSNPRRIFGDILPNRYVIGYLPINGVDIRH